MPAFTGDVDYSVRLTTHQGTLEITEDDVGGIQVRALGGRLSIEPDNANTLTLRILKR